MRKAPFLSPPLSGAAPLPWSPFLLCLFGMTAGMAVDYRRTGLLMLDYCGDAADLGLAIDRHLAAMPNMYLGVALAAAIGICRDIRIAWGGEERGRELLRSLACTGLMLMGMLAASLILMRLTGLFHPAAEWLAMTLGMLGGHAACPGRRSADG